LQTPDHRGIGTKARKRGKRALVSQRRRNMAAGRARCGFCIIGFIVVVAIVALAVIYSGIYSVAANYPDNAAVEWLLSTTMDHSVRRHAAGIQVPPLDDPAMIQAGFNHYRRMCRGCHGAPGVENKGGPVFNPEPPELTEETAEWKPNELFWITKNGVRMSGMPAWSPSHSDEDIWAIVAFTRKLPTMTAAQYQAMEKKAPTGMRR